MYFNTKNKPVNILESSVWILNPLLEHSREVMKTATLPNMIVNNNLYESVEPSIEDKNITDILIKVYEILGTKLSNHRIIG